MLQLIPFTMAGDYRKTGEAFFGVYLFNATRASNGSVIQYNYDGEVKDLSRKMYGTSFTTDNKSVFIDIKKLCRKNPQIKRVEWKHLVSINGMPPEEIINEPNACLLEYKLLSHNDWIKVDGEAKVMPNLRIKTIKPRGFEAPNVCAGSVPITSINKWIDNKMVYEFTATTKNKPIIMPRFVKVMSLIYWLCWIATLIYLVAKVVRKTREARNV
jgi:hypothetical protein